MQTRDFNTKQKQQISTFPACFNLVCFSQTCKFQSGVPQFRKILGSWTLNKSCLTEDFQKPSWKRWNKICLGICNLDYLHSKVQSYNQKWNHRNCFNIVRLSMSVMILYCSENFPHHYGKASIKMKTFLHVTLEVVLQSAVGLLVRNFKEGGEKNPQKIQLSFNWFCWPYSSTDCYDRQPYRCEQQGKN